MQAFILVFGFNMLNVFEQVNSFFFLDKNKCNLSYPNIIANISNIHTLRVYFVHAAANLNSGYTKYAKVAHVHYFCTIALQTPYA